MTGEGEAPKSINGRGDSEEPQDNANMQEGP